MELIDTKAYAVFCRELSGYGKLLNELISAENLNIERLKEIRIAAHRIKGGAGFFGLERIGELGGTLEVISMEDPKQIAARIPELSRILMELSVLIKLLLDPEVTR